LEYIFVAFVADYRMTRPIHQDQLRTTDFGYLRRRESDSTF